MSDWTRRIPVEEAAVVVRRALAAGVLSDAHPAMLAHDLGLTVRRFRALEAAFPAGTLHAVAVKANPLLGLLERLVAEGAGLECASAPELELALAAGCPPERIVFDSPAKTVSELERALDLGVRVNADNFDELYRIARLRGDSPSPVGLRLNPLVGEGAIAATSVAGRGSKFGVPMSERRAIAEAFARYDWLSGLHVHVGSQGCAMPMLVEAVQRVWAFARELGPGRVTTLDLGGGLPTRYREEDPPFEVDDYARALADAVPEAFGSVRLVTEFGRALLANCGFAASRVEYTKSVEGENMAVVHLGADLLLRRAYRPEDWFHELVVLDAHGHPKPTGHLERWSVAGPLCFSGDMLARNIPLPPIEPGDMLVVRDVGAYTLGMWSRYCSRQIPPVLGYEEPEGPLVVLREPETADEVVAFWRPRRGGPIA